MLFYTQLLLAKKAIYTESLRISNIVLKNSNNTLFCMYSWSNCIL